MAYRRLCIANGIILFVCFSMGLINIAMWNTTGDWKSLVFGIAPWLAIGFNIYVMKKVER